MSSPLKPYPPCQNPKGCTDSYCCDNGYKVVWTNLTGADPQVAIETIKRDNPLVSVEVVPIGTSITTKDFCCNRVLLFLDQNGKVDGTPLVA